MAARRSSARLTQPGGAPTSATDPGSEASSKELKKKDGSKKRGRAPSTTETPLPVPKPTAKRTKVPGAATTLTLGPVTQEPLKLTIPGGRSPSLLPPRSTRVIDPAGPDKPRPKRTSEEVAEAAQRKADLQKQLEALEKQRLLTLAQMEVEIEEAQMNEDDEAIMDITDLELLVDAEVMSISDDVATEDLEGDEMQANSDLMDADIEPGTPTSASHSITVPTPDDAPGETGKKKGKKPSKRATRGQVDALKESFTAHGKTQTMTALSKRAKPAPAPFLTGLASNWQNKKLQKSSGLKGHPSAIPKALPADGPALGGLNDDDVFAEHPGSVAANNRGHDFIDLSGASSDSEALPKPSPAYLAKKTPRPKKQNIKVKKDAGRARTPPPPGSSGPLPTITTAPELSNLPDIVRAGYLNRFLPTLYHRFGASTQPWNEFTKGAGLLHIVQEVVNICFPDACHQVLYGDALFTAAYDRLNEKKSFFSSEAVRVVEAFFRQSQFADNPVAIADYARYAMRDNGPVMWRVPTPKDCTGKAGEPGYVSPQDPFETDLIIKVFSKFLAMTKGSCGDFGHCVGAISMTVTAIERAFKMHLTGKKVTPGQFSRENTVSIVDDYMTNAKKLTARRWKRILDRCGFKQRNTMEFASVATSTLEKNRRLLYTPSSPIASDNEI
ncbi:hypothetical protein HYDPIDRAFT_30702 [Hydnomerulius pinastri MD-312]|uniref:Uncharacterized protein n=1 Tax=Hydnomerulius pinastri MD-312 TaxID=994086 RepID=A0A0C9W5X5_9AGAM|nr:hypothetical protein HYDPIDRAFT_30702 [Hydnomerulius pinastri MD-312]